MAQLVFLDVEATGVEVEDRLIQVAYRHHDGGQATVVNELFKPPVPIKLPAMAVHHITEKVVADKPPFAGGFVHTRLLELAAHPDVIADYLDDPSHLQVPYDRIARSGASLHSRNAISRIVLCTDDALTLYRD